MKNIISRLGLCVLMALPGCGDGIMDYWFNHDGYVYEKSHANVMREFDFFGEVEFGVAEGFDLDEKVSDNRDESTCYSRDYTTPEGQTGVDNQLAKIWADIEPIVGEAVRGLIQGSINEGRFLMMVELTGVDDLVNDDDVTLHLFRGQLNPLIGTLGLISPNQTYDFDSNFASSVVENVQIIDGVVEAGPVEFQVPVDILEVQFPLHVSQGKIRFEIKEDGTFEGMIGGFMDVDYVMDILVNSDARQEAELVRPLFEDNADMSRVDGRCRLFSSAFHFKGTTGFVVRHPDAD